MKSKGNRGVGGGPQKEVLGVLKDVMLHDIVSTNTMWAPAR